MRINNLLFHPFSDDFVAFLSNLAGFGWIWKFFKISVDGGREGGRVGGMTKKQAEQKGLVFHGCYERDKKLVQEKVRELKKQGYNAVLVTVPDSSSLCGEIGRGWSVYVESKYFEDLRAEEKRAIIFSLYCQAIWSRFNWRKMDIPNKKD